MYLSTKFEDYYNIEGTTFHFKKGVSGQQEILSKGPTNNDLDVVVSKIWFQCCNYCDSFMIACLTSSLAVVKEYKFASTVSGDGSANYLTSSWIRRHHHILQYLSLKYYPTSIAYILIVFNFYLLSLLYFRYIVLKNLVRMQSLWIMNTLSRRKQVVRTDTLPMDGNLARKLAVQVRGSDFLWYVMKTYYRHPLQFFVVLPKKSRVSTLVIQLIRVFHEAFSNPGKQKSNIKCVREDDGEVVKETFCSHLQKPLKIRVCNLRPCVRK